MLLGDDHCLCQLWNGLSMDFDVPLTLLFFHISVTTLTDQCTWIGAADGVGSGGHGVLKYFW